MNREGVAQAVVACERLAAALRDALGSDARAELAEQGTAPTWRARHITIGTTLTRDAVVVVDDDAFTVWVSRRFPTEVVTSTVVRPAFARGLLAGAARRGDPPCTGDGEVIPGVVFRPGGQVRSVSLTPSAELSAWLDAAAEDIVAGRAPLALPAGPPKGNHVTPGVARPAGSDTGDHESSERPIAGDNSGP